MIICNLAKNSLIKKSVSIFVLFLLIQSCSTFSPNKDRDLDGKSSTSTSKNNGNYSVKNRTIGKDISVRTAVQDRNYFKINNEEIVRSKDYVDGSYIFNPELVSPENQGPVSFILKDGTQLGLKNYSFDFPVVYNKATEKWVNYFSTRGRDYLETYLSRSGRYAPLMSRILEENGLPKDLIFLVMAESGFANQAKSRAKAVGPWQFMKRTAENYGLKIDWFMDERRDPIKASYAASEYLKDLHQIFGTWELAAAAYNAGEGKIFKALRKSDGSNFWDISKGKYLKKETRNYVPKIMALAIIGKNLPTFGFEEILFEEPLEFEIVKVAPLTDLHKVAQVAGIDFEEIKRWNPELTKWMTPPYKEYSLRFPPGYGEKFRMNYQTDQSAFQAKDFQIYSILKTESVEKFANKMQLPKDIIYHLNPQLSGEVLKKNMVVTLPFREGEPISSYLEKNTKNRRAKSKNKNSASSRNTFTLNTSRDLSSKIAQKR